MELCYSEDGKSLGKETLLDTKWLDPAVKSGVKRDGLMS